MKIKISKVKAIREELGLTHIIIFGIDESGVQHIATHGQTVKNAKEAAIAGNKLKKTLGWPENLCHDQPLDRICRNCYYYKPDYGIFTATGWTGRGDYGICKVLPDSSPHKKEDEWCSFFEPKT